MEVSPLEFLQIMQQSAELSNLNIPNKTAKIE